MMYLRLNITLTLVNVTSYFACCQKLFSRKSNHTCICEDNKGLNIIELINWPNLLSHLLAKFSFSKKSNCFKVIQTNTVKHVLFILQKKNPTFAQIFLWKKKKGKLQWHCRFFLKHYLLKALALVQDIRNCV